MRSPRRLVASLLSWLSTRLSIFVVAPFLGGFRLSCRCRYARSRRLDATYSSTKTTHHVAGVDILVRVASSRRVRLSCRLLFTTYTSESVSPLLLLTSANRCS